MVDIWGIYSYGQDREVSKFEMEAMGKQARHRLCDRQEIAFFGSSGMGQLPLKCRNRGCAVYPMRNENKSLCLVFDGFISNYCELREFLVKKGHHFNYHGDSGEVVLHLFEENKEEGFKLLNGMYAFAIWDDGAKELILARDRFGIRPLFYYDNGKTLIFSSSIKSILSTERVEKRLNFQAFYDYLSLNYVPFGQTVFQDIEKVPIRSYMKYSKRNKSIRRYWDFKIEPELKIKETQIEEELGYRLKTAVKNLLPSETQAGVFLSGGLDSSAITYYLKDLGQNPIDTFTVSFKEKEYDESGYAQVVASHLGTRHRTTSLDDRFIKDYERIIACYENLHTETAQIPFYYLAQAAGRSKSCMLCGESGDELLGGYPELLADRLLPYYKKIPLVLRRFLLKPMVNILPVSDAPVGFDYKAKHFSIGAEKEPLKAHFYWREVFTEEEKSKLFSRDFYDLKDKQETFERYNQQINHYRCNDIFKSFQLGYLNVLVPDNNLPHYNKLCSIHGIDVRYPFLDYELVDFILRIPMSLKLKGNATKYIVRRLLRGKLPSVVVSRKKHGLSCPVKMWMRSRMRDIFAHRLSKANLKNYPYLNPTYVERLLNEHFAKKVDNSRKIWGLFSFVVWHKKHFGQ